jgi:hypothetical protein
MVIIPNQTVHDRRVVEFEEVEMEEGFPRCDLISRNLLEAKRFAASS